MKYPQERKDSKVDVLILTASYGGGHMQAAKALSQALKKLEPCLNIETLDYVRWINTRLDSFTKLAYVKVTSKAPSLWHLLYDITDRPFFAKHGLTRRLGYQRLYSYIMQIKPKIIVSTHFLTSAVVGELKKRKLISTPLVTVITDNVLHAFWLNSFVDLYLVANENIKRDLIQYGVASEKVETTGIPIDLKFSVSYDKMVLRQQHHLIPRLPTILIMSGAYGIGDITGICHFLAHFEHKIQVIVIAGKDKRLKRKITNLTYNSKNNFHILGYVTNVFELMNTSDLLISKAGGLTTSEALASNLPMLIYKPIPGQEEGNATYLRNAGAAVIASNMDEFIKWFNEIVFSDSKLKAMSQACLNYKKPLAALRGSELLLDRFKLS
ncbi:glycosyltransferase [Bacillota bacterium LX-D]|nr:glycosyltransferase [Bacillota bacterium LX-D]